MKAELIVLNAKVYTGTESSEVACELAVGMGRILRVGPLGCTRDLAETSTQILDLEGSQVLPGLCDSHIHFVNYALSLQELNLQGVASLGKVKERLAERTKGLDPGTWVRGRGWDQNLWPENRFPTAQDLDDVVGPNIPVLLYAKSGHAGVASSAALRSASITAGNWSPEGGEIVRNENGQPTGLLLEGPAIQLVASQIPESSETQILEAALNAQKQLHEWGITSIHDFDGRMGLETFQSMMRHDQLRLRAVNHIALDQLDDAIAFGIRGPLGGEWFQIGGLKMFADGALGPRTALMVAPYEGEPDNYGMAVTDKEEMLEHALRATYHGIASAIHAIGDRAVHDVLDVLSELRRAEQEMGVAPWNRRHRIEHVQLIQPEDIPRLRELEVSGAVQPIHATQDKNLVDAFWGHRGQYAYAFQSLLQQGIRLAYGSDAPVETPNPFWGMYAGVTRQRQDEKSGSPDWYPEQKLKRAQMIQGYTSDAAYLEGWDRKVGAIRAGFNADFFVPDHNLLTCTETDLANASSLLTVAGGEIVHSR